MTMNLVQKLKRCAAVLLVCAAFLPLSRCSYHDGAPPPELSFWQHLFPRDQGDWVYSYAFKNNNFSVWGVVTVLAFTWPLLLMLLFRKRAGRWVAWLTPTLELLLCASTAYWIVYALAPGRFLYGAYVAFFALLLYAGGVLFGIVDFWRTIRLRRPLLAPSG